MDGIQPIYVSMMNGQRKQAADQIDEYGLYEFWEDYLDFLDSQFSPKTVLKHYSDSVIAYHRIRNR